MVSLNGIHILYHLNRFKNSRTVLLLIRPTPNHTPPKYNSISGLDCELSEGRAHLLCIFASLVAVVIINV